MKENIKKNPIHLGLGATTFSEPEFSGLEWYEAYSKRHVKDGPEGRLVSMHTFSESWEVWEMHPKGSEVVLCVQGTITLIQEVEGQEQTTVLGENEYAINPPGVWHTANVDSVATALFITAGESTQHRSRDKK